MKRYALIALVVLACAPAHPQSIQQQTVAAATNALAAASAPPSKRLASVRTLEAPAGGSRVVVTSDTSLGDYEAYNEAGRFVVLIPSATAPKIQQELRGRGFTDASVGSRGADVMLSFRLDAGARARVAQRFNRLEIIFETALPQEGSTQSVAEAAPTPTPTPTPTPAPVASPSPSPVPPETKSPTEATNATTVPSSTAASPQTAKAPAPPAVT